MSSTMLGGLKSGAPEAWRRLSRLYAPEVYRWCLQRRLSREDAADVVQEVFRVVWAKVAEFRRDREGDTFRGWLWTITQNKAREWQRLRRRRGIATGGSDAYARLSQIPADHAPAAAESGLSAGSGNLCRRALELIRAEFEERTWRAFWKVVVDGREPSDVAAELGMSRNSVYLAKSRVLRRLREELCEEPD